MITLSKIANLRMGVVLNRKKADMSKEQKLYYSVVSLKSFNENAIYDNTFADEFISNEQIKEDYQVKQGDILLRLREPNFAVYIDKEYENLIYPSLMVRVKLQDSRFDANFIAHYLNSNTVKKALSTELSGTTIPMIKVTDVYEIKIPLINLDKQKKIVEYLKLAHQENELLQNLINQKQKYSKEIFETLALQGE
ncbi:restriction endonuclease subunit S [Aliarcobacter butzleri]|uniref:Restriction endonuclease subunit S n=1 Tax=Aliarcobacter butzleri TaxID=28197 RepID=A0AAP4UYD4_9BACT|nr:restriction endonuclease subunit S [Aliarcobacter butzleri]MCG3676240.1 restriction endonuclease subunit S [Aliarcobacter butzleri]MCG3712739.1 restriction endonuclease subunit S [Aliarcobacter butzleri]MCT7570926.1 restriction endonuclease subunit S [Aliarcobacter butzleri]MDK2051645.1 restriction endonuclease subunit S [Aliarcobacter butzleri]MDK2065036.1 restriction endonuclease subunit S [Aliarcobacter butzleri]